MKKISLFALLVIGTIGCGLKDKMKESYAESDKLIADQYFKHAVAIIELYKIRHGVYPETLKEIDFTSTMDNIIYSIVDYQKLDNGYRLDIGKGLITKKQTKLSYPPDFWKGLGLRESNVYKTMEPVKEK